LTEIEFYYEKPKHRFLSHALGT